MKKEEALQNRIECLKYLEGCGPKANPACVEAVRWSVKALQGPTRDDVEKAWKGEWVKKHKHRGGFRRATGVDDMGEEHTITIDERCEYDDLYCGKCGKQSADNFLDFCPACGAPMTAKAVDIIMERLKELSNEDNG